MNNRRRLGTYSASLLLKKVIQRLVRYSFAIILYIPATILALFGFRCQHIDLTKIGHISISLLCIKNDERFSIEKLKVFVPVNSSICNDWILKYFPSNYILVTNSILIFLLKTMCYNRAFTLPGDDYVIQTGKSPKAHFILRNGYTSFSLSSADRVWLEERLSTNYPLKSNWFICVSDRTLDSGRQDSHTQDYRNCSILNYSDSIDWVIKSGGTVFRLGSVNSDHLTPRPYLYDVRKLGAGRLHLCLAAECQFFLGCSSGIAFLSTFFGRPVALANMIPITTMPLTSADVAIHKPIFSKIMGRQITFQEYLAAKIRHGFVSSMYEEEFIIKQNSSADILHLTQIMYSILRRGDYTGAELMDLQKKDYAFGGKAKFIKLF